MNVAQRFTLLVKGSINGLLDSLEDPERSLNQLVLDMEEQLEAAKQAAARAIANEDRLRAKAVFHKQDAAQWEDAARRAIGKETDGVDAREPLRRAELATRQAERLEERLAEQQHDTSQIRLSVARMHDQIGDARSRLQLLQARMRQGEARRAIAKVMRGVESANLYGEFERLGDRVEMRAATDAAYLQLGDELAGDDLRRRCAEAEVDDAVDARLRQLRAEKQAAEDREET
ncbi:MAG: PspA/IM30 family protein [Thermoanaerobaculia bacterium]